jgi:hypothetical protein
VDCKSYLRDVLHCRAMARLSFLIGLLLVAAGCDNSARITRLEKQDQELQAEQKKGQATPDFDLQARCSKDARAWFNETWSRDKDTIVLDFTNHYNKSLNKCFILIEFHYVFGKEESWVNDMTLWDVYENSKYGNFSETHEASVKRNYLNDRVSVCRLWEKKCKTLEEFNGLVRPYMND